MSTQIEWSLRRRAGLSGALCALLALGACANLKPEPLSASDIRAVAAADRGRAGRDVEALRGPLTLEEAVARALKYNLGARAKQMEEAVARGQLDAGRYDLLPKLIASAGYTDRNKDLITRSTDSVTGQPSLAHPYINSDKSAFTTDVGFTWSLLDFGQSYYAARQGADRALIAGERRRRATHALIQDVRTAFWRTAVAQKLHRGVAAAIAGAEDALAESRKVESERLRNPVDALRYQRQLLENMRLLEAIEQELAGAQIELAALIDLPPGAEFTVAEPASPAAARWQDVPVERLEEQAIANNAELRETFYNARIANLETRRALLKLFPGVSFNYGVDSSDDSYLIYKHWTQAGAQLSFNLLGLLSAPAQMRLADAGVALADQQRMVTQMVLLAQVHLARLQYRFAQRQFERADTIWQVDRQLAEHSSLREQAQTQTKLDRVGAQTAAILSELRRYQALALVQSAAGKLQATLGLEPVVQADRDASLADITQAVAASLKQWDQARLPDAQATGETH
ncbi:MAG: TolC family protein [Burkholderiaceae bacterium]